MDLMQIGSHYSSGLQQGNVTEARMKRLSDDIKGIQKDSTDEELMKACKSFESYMVEQVMTKMEEMAHIEDKKEKDNEYVAMFKDGFMRDMAQIMTENTDFGIAKMLYESMKRNVVSKPETLDTGKK